MRRSPVGHRNSYCPPKNECGIRSIIKDMDFHFLARNAFFIDDYLASASVSVNNDIEVNR